jgi:hypothetical protein
MGRDQGVIHAAVMGQAEVDLEDLPIKRSCSIDRAQATTQFPFSSCK